MTFGLNYDSIAIHFDEWLKLSWLVDIQLNCSASYLKSALTFSRSLEKFLNIGRRIGRDLEESQGNSKQSLEMGRSFRILEKSLEEFQIFPIFQKILERSWKESKNPTNPPKNLKESWKDAEEIERILKLRNLKGSSKESQEIPKLFFNNPNESFKESSNYPEDPKRNLKESFKDPRNIEIIFEIIPKLFDNLKESFKKNLRNIPKILKRI